MFGISHFPTNLTFEFYDQEPRHVNEDSTPKTPVKKQKEQLWHLETQDQTERKEKE